MGGDHGWGGGLAQAELEGVRSVGDAAVAGLLPDAGCVVLPSQMVTPSEVVALDGSCGACEPLGAASAGLPPHVTLDLTDLDRPAWSSSQPVEILCQPSAEKALIEIVEICLIETSSYQLDC